MGDHTGNFYQRSMTDIELGIIHDGASIGASMKYEGKLDERELCYIQVAVLYTSSSGERRVRVLNMSMGVTGLIGNVFRFADLDAAVTLYAKEGEFIYPSRTELKKLTICSGFSHAQQIS